MESGCLIDSNIVIGYLDSKLPPKGMEKVGIIVDDIPNVSVITKIEVLRFNTLPAAYQVLEDFISECNVLGLDSNVVDMTIAICKTSRIKLPDAIIAATAIVNNLTLVTRNISDFKNIEGLELLNPWAEDNGRAL